MCAETGRRFKYFTRPSRGVRRVPSRFFFSRENGANFYSAVNTAACANREYDTGITRCYDAVDASGSSAVSTSRRRNFCNSYSK